MKTDEFIKKMYELGYVISIKDSILTVYIKSYQELPLLELKVDQQFSLQFKPDNIPGTISYKKHYKNLYDLVKEYDETPVDKREK